MIIADLAKNPSSGERADPHGRLRRANLYLLHSTVVKKLHKRTPFQVRGTRGISNPAAPRSPLTNIVASFVK
jgi:hypothetical protein